MRRFDWRAADHLRSIGVYRPKRAKKLDNLSFGEKAYSAAKLSAVLDGLVPEGVSLLNALNGSAVSLGCCGAHSRNIIHRLRRRRGLKYARSPSARERRRSFCVVSA